MVTVGCAGWRGGDGCTLSVVSSPVQVAEPSCVGAWLAALEARLAEVDPEVLQASYEVDRGLIRWSLAMSPLERLRAATRSARVLARLRRAADESGTTERG